MTDKQQRYLKDCFENCGKTAKIIAYEMDISESTLSRAKNSGFNSLSISKLDALIIAIGANKKEYIAFGKIEESEPSPLTDMNALIAFFENQIEHQRRTFDEALETIREDYENSISDLKKHQRRLLFVLSTVLILLVLATFADALNGTFGYIRR